MLQPRIQLLRRLVSKVDATVPGRFVQIEPVISQSLLAGFAILGPLAVAQQKHAPQEGGKDHDEEGLFVPFVLCRWFA